MRIRIRICRIRMFLDLPDPSIVKKNSKKTLDFYCLVTFYDFLSLITYVKCTSVPDPDPGLDPDRVSQRCGSEDPDPDPY